MDDLPELLKLMQPLRVRQGAVELVLRSTSDASSLLHLVSNKEIISSLWDCLADKDKKLSVTAAQALVNITSRSDKYTPSEEAIPRLLLVFHSPAGEYLYNSIAMILNNMSRSAAQAELFSKLIYLPDCQLFTKLLSNGKEQGYLAAVMGNIALSDKGREILTNDLIMPDIISLLTMPGNLVVRRNVARLLRNLAFDVKTHQILVSHLPQIIYPLVGGEDIDEDDMEKLPIDLQYLPEDKERERDLQIRVLLSDTLFQMGSTFDVREVYRRDNYYVLLKNYDLWEEDLDAREHVQNVIYIIIQDDGEVNLRKADELPSEVEPGDTVEIVKLEKEDTVDIPDQGEVIESKTRELLESGS